MSCDLDTGLLPSGHSDFSPTKSPHDGKGFCSRSGARKPERLYTDLRVMVGLSGLVQPRNRFGLCVSTVGDLAALVHRQRRNLGISQSELAQRAVVGRRFVSEFEGGKVTVRLDEVLKVLAACELALIGQRKSAN